MTTPSTSAPVAHAERAPLQQVNDLASEIQSQVHRMASLVHAIDDAIEFQAGDPWERVGTALGRAIDFINIHEEIALRVLEMAEKIESISLSCGRGDMGKIDPPPASATRTR